MPSPPEPPSALRPPALGAIFWLVALLLGLGLWIHAASRGVMRTSEVVRIPGAAGVQATWLPKDLQPSDLTIDQAARLDAAGAFVPIPPPETTRPLNRRLGEDRWYRLTLDNPQAAPRSVVLDLVWRIYDEVTLYQPRPDGGWAVTRAGAAVSPDDPHRSPRWRAYELTLPAAQSTTVYLRARDAYRLPTQFFLWLDPNEFIRWERFMFAEYSGYFCLWVGMVTYAIFLYAMLRQRDQLHYVRFVILLGLLVLVASGLTTLFFPWPFIPVGEMVFGLLVALTLIQLCLFARYFLDTPSEDPALDRRLRRLQWIAGGSVLTLPIILWPPVALHYLQGYGILAVGIMGTLLAASIRRWRARCRQAPFFLLAFTPYVFGISLWMLSARDTVVRDNEQRLASLIGNGLSLLLLSLAAAYRHRLAIEENIRLQASYTTRLEQEVAERTRVLQKLTDRLGATVSERERILAIIGHDLRVPVGWLQGLANLLAEDAASFTREQLAELAREIGQTCSTHLELLNNLLMWGGAQSGHWQMKPESLSLKEAVTTAWRPLERLAQEKDLAFDEAIDPQSTAHIDSQVLQTILRNLLGNAIKFTPPGGRIEVRAVPGPALHPPRVELRVRDDGVGISAERLTTLFSGVAQSTTGTQGERGVGIGLNLCRDLARAAQGDIQIESTPGVGTVALVTLPVGPVISVPASA